ncbi:MAG: hypothetical protein ACRDMV_01475 [Streptosporangiales bacterium]
MIPRPAPYEDLSYRKLFEAINRFTERRLNLSVMSRNQRGRPEN